MCELITSAITSPSLATLAHLLSPSHLGAPTTPSNPRLLFVVIQASRATLSRVSHLAILQCLPAYAGLLLR